MVFLKRKNNLRIALLFSVAVVTVQLFSACAVTSDIAPSTALVQERAAGSRPSQALRAQASASMSDLTALWDEERFIANPDKGWFHHYYDDANTRYKTKADTDITNFPGMHHLYLRMAWSTLEPAEGQFNWAVIDELVDKWYKNKGYKFGITITASETGTTYATPEWVKLAGAQGAFYPLSWAPKENFWEPKFDDPIFFEKLENFYKAFSARYKNAKWLQYVDIGSYGNWGEGHTSFSNKKPISIAAVKKHLELFHKYFNGVNMSSTDTYAKWSRTPTEETELKNFIQDKGFFWRDNSVLVDYWLRAYPQTFSVDRPACYEDTYKTRPTVIELEHYAAVKKEGNWQGKNGAIKGAVELQGAIEVMRATYVGFHGYADEWLKENPDLAKFLGNRMGYWFFLEGMDFSALKPGETVNVKMRWTNKGVAPAYMKYKTHIRLVQNFGARTAFDFDLSNQIDTRLWIKGTTPQNAIFNLPTSVMPGQYKVQIFLQRYVNEADISNIDLGFNSAQDVGGKVFEVGMLQIQ